MQSAIAALMGAPPGGAAAVTEAGTSFTKVWALFFGGFRV